ncbi:RCC1 domain-containing protein [Pseudomonas sp. R1-6]|uniref:RCC1 domain-containing protein n=1 Tax=Pseudomonas sp. R1-6 TaxID=2817397 RepID=UPI003DA85C98
MNDTPENTAMSTLLPPPSVEGMVDGAVLDPDSVPQGIRVQVPAASLAEGDHARLDWTDAAGVVPAYSVDKPYSHNDVGKPLSFTVAQAEVRRFLDRSVALTYTVQRLADGADVGSEVFSFRVAKLPLSAPTILEARDGQLNPDDLSASATVQIPREAWLKVNDVVRVSLMGAVGEGSTVVTHTVALNEAGQALEIALPYSVINANEGRSVVLSYTVNGAEPSPEAVYSIKRDIGSGELRVMGARYNRGLYRCSGCSRRLSAFQAATGRPILAQWRYDGDDNWVVGATFRDTDASRRLQVRSIDYQITLSPANVFGNGLDGALTGVAAFIARRGIGDLVGWGNSGEGATIPATIISMDDIVEVSATAGAYAARRANGNVVAWGTATQGASMGDISRLDFVRVVGNGAAFAGIKRDGTLVAWGDPARGGSLPAPIAELTDFVRVHGASSAFVAIRRTGGMVAWGAAAGGGVLSDDIATLTDIEEVLGNDAAFVALRGNRRLIAWGAADQGGALPEAIAYLDDIAEISCANAKAFVALRASGQIVAWGAATHGGVLPELIRDLDDIVEITANWQSFVARRENGHLVAWGSAETGGAVSDDVARLNDIVQVVGSSKAFAALRKDGSVVAWGDVTVGGDTALVAESLIDVQAIYGNSHGFAALTAGGQLVTWGHVKGGGDSAAVQALLDGRVDYYLSAQSVTPEDK